MIWAITAKDMMDALKNRTTLSVILISLFVVVAYRYLAGMMIGGSSLNLLVYDAGETSYWSAFEASHDPEVHGPYPTQRTMEHDLLKGFVPELGLVIPEDFDQRVAAGDAVELDGYAMHWVGQSEIVEMVSAAEGFISGIVGKPVRIESEGNTIYAEAEVFGFPMFYSLGLVIGMAMVGISLIPNMMIEERRAKTIDALLISPAGTMHVVIGKALTGMFYCLIIVAVGVAFASSLVVEWWLFVLATLTGALFSVAIGLILGSVFKERHQLMTWGFFLSFPLLLPLFLSFMRGLLPEALLSILQWVPTVALGKIFRVSFSENAQLSSFGLQLALVVGCTLFLLAAVVWVMRRSDRR
jgi:ABC-type polysaccharide/polyol phosphate export permease